MSRRNQVTTTKTTTTVTKTQVSSGAPKGGKFDTKNYEKNLIII